MTRSRNLVLAVCLVCVSSCSQDADQPQKSLSGTPARRIVALAPHLTELVFTAGAGDRLVGVVEFSDFPATAQALPRVGDAFRLDYEAIAALEPDLILGWVSGNPESVFTRLRDLGYRVVALEPVSLEGVAEHLRIIGRLAGTSATADRAAAEYAQALVSLRDRYRGAADISVLYQISVRPMLTISRRHVIGEAIEICGGRNIFANLDELAPAVSVEAILDRAPEVIIASGAGPNVTQLPDGLSVWARWPSIPAVRNGNLYVVDADLIVRPSTRILGGVRRICEHLETARRKKLARAEL